MTAMDSYEPKGKPIHPYDVYDLLANGKSFGKMAASPAYEDEADYHRNREKSGEEMEVDGVLYFVTCAARPSPGCSLEGFFPITAK